MSLSSSTVVSFWRYRHLVMAVLLGSVQRSQSVPEPLSSMVGVAGLAGGVPTVTTTSSEAGPSPAVEW